MAKTTKEYEQLGRMLENLYESSHATRRKLYRISFFKGVASGFGGVLGATILIALLVWALTLFKQVPLLGPLTHKVEKTIQLKDIQN